MRRAVVAALIIVLASALTACASPPASTPGKGSAAARRLAVAAESQVGKTVTYDAAYAKLDYPGGDVPVDRGVCTDVVVRAFRAVGTDLQVEVHEDMSSHFAEYPNKWGLSEPDTNIDHRRVPNLQTYFRRRGAEVTVSNDPGDYWPGDVVTWMVLGRPHVGIVSTVLARGGGRYCIVHNIGAGTRIEDRLFEFTITGHYRPS